LRLRARLPAYAHRGRPLVASQPMCDPYIFYRPGRWERGRLALIFTAIIAHWPAPGPGCAPGCQRRDVSDISVPRSGFRATREASRGRPGRRTWGRPRHSKKAGKRGWERAGRSGPRGQNGPAAPQAARLRTRPRVRAMRPIHRRFCAGLSAARPVVLCSRWYNYHGGSRWQSRST